MRKRSCKTPHPKNTVSRVVHAGLQTLGLSIAIACVTATAACGAPAVVEGVFAQAPLSLTDSQPAARVDSRGNQVHFLISEETETVLTVALVRLPSLDLYAGDTFAFCPDSDSDDDAHLQLSQGDLVEEFRTDGTRFLSSINNKFAGSVSGFLVLDEVEGVYAGQFEAEMDDGGAVSGRFVIER